MALSLVTAPATEPLTLAEVKAHLRLDSSNGEPAPTVPTVALATIPVAGNCDNGAHRVGVTFVTADGETEIGALSAVVTVADKSINGQLAISNIALGGSAVTARRLWLTAVGETTAKLAATLANNTATTATLNVADSALGAQAPTTNTTADHELVAWIIAAREYGETFTHRAFITQTWDEKRNGFPGYAEAIWLPKAPLVSVTSVTYVDTNGTTQTWSASLYTVDAPSGPKARFGCIVPNYGESYPATRDVVNAVTIRFVAGYGSAAAVPSLVKACLKELTRAYRLRGDADDAVTILKWVDTQLWGYKAF